MNTSRKDGILYFNDVEYKIAIEGKQETRTEIICHDVDSKSENAALDLEQLIVSAIQNIPQSGHKASKKQLAEDEKNDRKFFDTEKPSLKQIDEQALNLQMAIQSNNAVRMSEVMDIFMELVDAGAVRCVGDQKIFRPIWESISRKDKMKIVFRYCAFFVNPLEVLLSMASSTEKKA